jgi:histidinol-phosphatase (PHP family)
MIKSSMHNHTNLCDGKNTPREMAEAAIALGFTDFGFSGHSTNNKFFSQWGLKDEIKYIEAINYLKKEYKDRINIYLGIENDYHGRTINRDSLDYLITSVHGFVSGDKNEYYSIDDTVEELILGIDKVYKGDSMKMIEGYFHNLCKAVELDSPDIIGHFDLPTKLNKGNVIFNEKSNEYLRLAKEAIRHLVDKSIFEVNTGAIYRGYREFPYPREELLYYILKENGRVTISGDAHNTEGINYWFDEGVMLLRDIGYKEIYEYKNSHFKRAFL